IVPSAEQFGTANITLTVANSSGGTASTIFQLAVNFLNHPPALNPIANLSINEDAGTQTVSLTGISSGSSNENQILTVSAVSSNPALIPNPAVNYGTPNSTGTLSFAPLLNATGVVTILVIVNDGQATNNAVTNSFTITVNPVNDPPTLDPI